MVTVVELSEHQEPPQGVDWVLVTSEGWDGSPVEGQIDHHELGATFFAPEREPEFSNAIERATAWADRQGIDTIYVQRRHGGF